MCAKLGSGVFFYLFQKEMWLKIFLSFNLLREIGGLKGKVGRWAKWGHTCKKRVIPVIYQRNFFWIFRKILG